MMTLDFHQFDKPYEVEVSPEQDLTFSYASEKAAKQGLEFDEGAFLSLGLRDKEGQYTNLARLLSDQNHIVLKLAKYDDASNFKIKKEFDGSLLKILDYILDYTEMLNTTSAVIPPYERYRVERKSFPGSSLREAVLNAICHANYMKPSNIKIEFYDDRVDITSPGGLVDGTLEQVLKGYQTYRNPGLVRILAKLEYIENFGKGLKRIIDAYADEERKPSFDVNNTYFRVSLPDLNSEWLGREAKPVRF